MITTVRRLSQSDDFSQVARLIYETDNYVFPHFFKDSKSTAMAILPYMIETDTIYNMNNIYVAELEGQIIGIMVINESPLKINIGAYVDAFERAGAMIDADFERVLKEYFLPLENESEGYFIPSFCIDKLFRGHGVGGTLLECVLEGLDPSKDIYLDCLSENRGALAIYTAHGFEKLLEYSGFTGLPYYKMIRRANHII